MHSNKQNIETGIGTENAETEEIKYGEQIVQILQFEFNTGLY